MAIDLKLIDKLLADYKKPEDIIGENGLLKQLTKALLERAMQAEMTEHLGYEKHDPVGNNSGNSRNGATTKTLKGEFGEMPLETPRDRNGSYEPKIVAKGQTRWTGFDDKIISMYSRGMSTREIQGHLEDMYKVEVSPQLISNVTEEVMEEVKNWQNRPLDAVYPIVYLDALVVKIRDAGHVRNKAIYVAIGVNMQGTKEVLGLWSGQAEGSNYWLQVLTEMKNRVLADIFIVCVDALKGLKPSKRCSLKRRCSCAWCINCELRLNAVSWKQRKQVGCGSGSRFIKPARSPTPHCGSMNSLRNGMRVIRPSVRCAPDHLTPFFAYPAEIRKVIYTTNAVESLNMSLRKVIKTRGSFPEPGSGDEVAIPGAGTHRQKVDYADPKLVPRCSVSRFCWVIAPRTEVAAARKNSKEQRFRDGALPQTPEIYGLVAPGFLDRKRRVALALPESRP